MDRFPDRDLTAWSHDKLRRSIYKPQKHVAIGCDAGEDEATLHGNLQVIAAWRMPSTLWVVLVLLAISVFINYVDRGNLSIAPPLLKDELGISAAKLGALLSAFFWTYVCMQLLSGWLVDRVDGNRVCAPIIPEKRRSTARRASKISGKSYGRSPRTYFFGKASRGTLAVARAKDPITLSGAPSSSAT
jgi:MFS family permease